MGHGKSDDDFGIRNFRYEDDVISESKEIKK